MQHNKPYRQRRRKNLRIVDWSYEHRGDHWRVLDGGHGIGPQYATEKELLADLDRLAKVYGHQ